MTRASPRREATSVALALAEATRQLAAY
jgi:hypothetical protein